jgi:hypothetical protein
VDLADTVAQDIYLRLDDPTENREEPIGKVNIVHSGDLKSSVWDRKKSESIALAKRLPQRFSMTVDSETSADEINDAANVRTVTIRRTEHNAAERRPKLNVLINTDGTCYPQIAIAPTKRPNYLEPDKKSFHLNIPDLIKTTVPVRPRSTSSFGMVLLMDFGTAVSCLSYIDVDTAILRQAEGEPLSDEAPQYQPSMFAGTVELRAQAAPIDEQDRRLVIELNALDSKLALGSEFERLLTKLNDNSVQCDVGQATELRTCLERTMALLAPDKEMKKTGLKPEAIGKPYTRRQHVMWVMSQRRNPHPKQSAKINNVVGELVKVAHARASDIIHGDVPPGRTEIERILRLWKTALFELLDV